MHLDASTTNQPSSGIPHTPALAVIAIMLIVVALPRLVVLGGLPATDEGAFAYFAQLMHTSIKSGNGLPDTGALQIYPLLVSWVFSFDAISMVSLRMVDMLVAVAAGYALYRVLEVESRSRWGALVIASLFLFLMNQPVFIQSGFKNSIHAAYIPLFTALWLGLTAPAGHTIRRWLGIGALLSVSVLLRETFLPLMALGILAVFLGHGLRPFMQVMAGAFIAGVLITGAMLVARGSLTGAIDAYTSAGSLYASVADKTASFFFMFGGQALHESAMAVIVAGIGFVITLLRILAGGIVTSPSRLGFWLAAALLPLIEPASKIGFPYHFAVCLPGLAGLAALGWRNVCEGTSIREVRFALVLTLPLLTVAMPRAMTLSTHWPQTRTVLASFPSGQWPESLVDRSNYLLASQVFRSVVPQLEKQGSKGTVAVSGFMYALYPLSGYLPPDPELANLTDTIIRLGLSSERLKERLLRCPPDVVMTTTRTDWPGSAELLAAVQQTGIYKAAYAIPVTNHRDYGSFGGYIFHVTKLLPCKPLKDDN